MDFLSLSLTAKRGEAKQASPVKQRSTRLRQSPVRKNQPITPGKENSPSPRKPMHSPPGRRVHHGHRVLHGNQPL